MRWTVIKWININRCIKDKKIEEEVKNKKMGDVIENEKVAPGIKTLYALSLLM